MSPTGEAPAEPPRPRRPAAFAHSRQALRTWRRDLFLRSRLLWHRAYRIVSYLKSALWVVPIVAILAVLMLAPAMRALDARLVWRFVGLEVPGARALYETVVTLTLSFLVFTFGSLLVAIQVAGGQLTPRIIATTLLRDNVVRYSVGLFVFTLVFAVMSLDRLGAQVYQLATFLTGLLGVVCMAVFLFLIDYAARLLRPVSVAARVGNEGQKVIAAVYPHEEGSGSDATQAPGLALGPPRRTLRHAGPSEIALAVDLDALLVEAIRCDGIVELVPQVGDFVARDEVLYALHGGAAAADDRRLAAAVAFGGERTMEQDPLFAFRILVDIAIKALSPAINDPTTAVESIAQIQRLLRTVGERHLHGEVVADREGRPRVILRTPNWEDFVRVACHEIRFYGAGNLQVARRLRAMLEDLLASLPKHRHAALREERDLLDRMIDAVYVLPEDRALARVPDSQGLGGSVRGKWRQA